MRIQFNIWLLLIVSFLITNLNAQDMDNNKTSKYEVVTFGSGCFWCTEAIFNLVEGVIKSVPGYSGGTEPKPSYELVCSGETRYAEVVQVTYDPEVIPFKALLEIFWQTHDPTTLNRQGADVGPQYRSVIFYHTKQQKEEAEYYKEQLNKEGIWKKPIVTEISPFTKFYQAEAYHLNYYENNPANGYCNYVITPKVEKFKKVFSDRLAK
ncbi:MAG: peptide-methionine (S)-S-oxide reductase MsrA [Bacteroidetes bacterium]|nr:peptide-methionine (S)-S-oxide reductase MsrA [Bacteroidota bacterium]